MEKTLPRGWLFLSSWLFWDTVHLGRDFGDYVRKAFRPAQSICNPIRHTFDLLDRLFQTESFEWPSADEREPMCHQHSQELRIQLAEHSIAFHVRRDLEATQAFPPFEKQFDLPAIMPP